MTKLRLLFALMFMLPVALHAQPPTLILQITVDQLRGDMLPRFSQRFGEGGFRYLLENGAVYSDARYRHSATLTAVGHSTLATGGNPRQHGIPANDWYDRGLGRRVNAVEDMDSPFVGGERGDPSGRSPRNLVSTTFSDELVLASNGQSRAFGVSTKDRGAILLAGKKGQAYWYDDRSGGYVSTTWYFDEYPAWVREWNAGRPADRYAGATWGLLADEGSYLYADQDRRSYEVNHGTLGTTFPHVMDDSTGGGYYGDLKRTPWADELTLDFTRALIVAEEVGQRGHTDYLSVSFSATDYIGHAFGPNSLEAEDNLLRLDRTVAALLEAVDDAVGLERALVVFSADHGVQGAPEWADQHGFEAGRLGSDDLLQPLNEAMSAYFQTSEKLVAAFQKPALYLDYEALHRAGVGVAHAEAKLAREVVKRPGFAHAFTRSDLVSGNLPDTAVARAVSAAFYPPRSGDVYVVPAPLWFFGHSAEGDAATHGTPWSGDAHVPIIFAGPGVRPGTVSRRVAPRDIAPTLSAYMGVLPPSSSVGNVLPEVVPVR